ncbi:MAG: hypothetical protein ABFS43_15955 [Thermodesulfobacteriota bacterium]
MKSRLIKFRDRITQSRAYFSIIKLPVILFTAMLGFMLEFVIELPFMVLCMLDRRRGRTEPQRTEDRATEPQRHKGHKENTIEKTGRVSADGGWTQTT